MTAVMTPEQVTKEHFANFTRMQMPAALWPDWWDALVELGLSRIPPAWLTEADQDLLANAIKPAYKKWQAREDDRQTNEYRAYKKATR